MHIAQTVKANVPPSNSVPGGRQHISLTCDKKLGRAKFLFCQRERCEHQGTLPHDELEGKDTNPNSDKKQKI